MSRHNQVRIIAGKWRGRKIKLAAEHDIRPTTDRIRETVFNWLNPFIVNAVCLDLFAGSGVLGFEALSRGAKKVVMVDKASTVIKALQENAMVLKTNDIEVIQAYFTPAWRYDFAVKFDIVFLDPPFRQNLLAPCCTWLEENDCLAKNAVIYLEAESTLSAFVIPKNWQLYKDKKTKHIKYALARRG